MAKKPKLDLEAIRALRQFHRENPEEEFIYQLFWRASGLLERSNLPNASIALEMIESAFNAMEGGLVHDDLRAAYPLVEWREDTVEVPRAWLRVLVEGWQKYKSDGDGRTLGEALGVEGSGQGKQPVRRQLIALNREIGISNQVLLEYAVALAKTGSASWEEAYASAAEAENVSLDTARRAWKKHGPKKYANLSESGLLDEGGNTS